MLTIVGISGSSRRGSFNSSLLRALAAAAPRDVEVRTESIAAIPLYNGDEEAVHGVPEPVAKRGEERDRLVLAAAGRRAARLSRQAGRHRRSFAGWIRHGAFAECMAAGVPHARSESLSRQASRLARWQRIRRQWQHHRC